MIQREKCTSWDIKMGQSQLLECAFLVVLAPTHVYFVSAEIRILWPVMSASNFKVLEAIL